MTFKNEAAKKILSQIDRHERVGINYEMDVYNSLLGHEGKRVEPLVQSAEVIYEYLFGEKIKPEAPDRASIWTDTNVYNEFGLPAIKIEAPRAAHRPAK